VLYNELMPDLLGNLLTDKKDDTKNVTFFRSILGIFVVFLFLGLLAGYFISRSYYKPNNLNQADSKDLNNVSFSSYEGIVTYVDPQLYPEDKIKFALMDSSGNEIILLRAKDQKLEVSEGHLVQVSGKKQKLFSTKGEYLLVESLVVKNATN